MVAAGSLGEAVWIKDGHGRVLGGAARPRSGRPVRSRARAPALPDRPARSAWSRSTRCSARSAPPGTRPCWPGTDHTACSASAGCRPPAALADPARRAALGPAAGRAEGPDAARRRRGGLRRPGGRPARRRTRPAGCRRLTAPPLDVLGRHHVDHVFAAWYVQDRRSSILLAVDVSGSMAEPAPGTRTPLIELVQQGCLRGRADAAGPVVARAVGVRLAARPAAGLPGAAADRAADRRAAGRAGRRGRPARRRSRPGPGSTTRSWPRTRRRPRAYAAGRGQPGGGLHRRAQRGRPGLDRAAAARHRG